MSAQSLGFMWLPTLPLAMMAIGAVIVLLAGARTEDEGDEGLGWLSLAFLAVCLVLASALIGRSGSAFGGAINIDNFAAFFELAIIVTAALTVLVSLEYAAEFGLAGAEYYALVLFATFGMMLMAAAGDLIVIFLGLETMSLCVYALAGFLRREPRSSEAALKYFLMGAFSTGFLLYGIALVYGATGTVKLAAIRTALAGPPAHNPLMMLGAGMLLVGFGFKVAAVPFHAWTPDAYEGAPTPVTGFMAAGVKLAAFAAFIRVFLATLAVMSPQWVWISWVLAVLTMTVGNLVALVQVNIKRMLAYSAIAHAGYVLVGVTTGGEQAGAAILYYLLGYVFATLGAFAAVVALERRGEVHDQIADFRGLASRRPALAAAVAFFMLSLTGVPPLAGFVGKFYVFSAALNAGFVYLVIIAVLNSVVSVYYYIWVIVAMYAQSGGAEAARLSARPGLTAAVIVATLATILIGLYPQPYIAAAHSAFASAIEGARTVHTVALTAR